MFELNNAKHVIGKESVKGLHIAVGDILWLMLTLFSFYVSAIDRCVGGIMFLGHLSMNGSVRVCPSGCASY